MFNSVSAYALTSPLPPDVLSQALEKARFQPCGKTEAISLGFVAPEDFLSDDQLVYTASGDRFSLGCLRIDKKSIPGSALKEAVKERAEAVERSQGYKPGRKQLKEIKEDVLLDLLPRVLASTKLVRFLVTEDYLLIDSSSNGHIDELITILAKHIEPFPIEAIQFEESVSVSMTQWLVDDCPPAGFSVDQEAEMKGVGGESVRWSKTSVDNSEAQSHLNKGKQCTKLAMTWDDKISFTLNQAGQLSRIKLLDVLTVDLPQAEHAEEELAGQMTLFGSEITALLGDLFELLGESHVAGQD